VEVHYQPSNEGHLEKVSPVATKACLGTELHELCVFSTSQREVVDEQSHAVRTSRKARPDLISYMRRIESSG
jgi:hypothetical protein